MPDQELTALRIKIEAEVANALKNLDSLSAKVQSVEAQVRQSVSKINASLKSFASTKAVIDVQVRGKEQVDAIKKEVEKPLKPLVAKVEFRADSNSSAGSFGMDGFVKAVQAGVKTSVAELQRFKAALSNLIQAQTVKFGVDSTEVKALKSQLEVIDGYIAQLKKPVKIRVTSEFDTDLKQQVAGKDKSFVIQKVVPELDDAAFNKLLQEVQNKRINITFNDIEKELNERLQSLEKKQINVTSNFAKGQVESEINAINQKLSQVKTIQVNANTKPAELSLKQLQDRATNILAKQQELKLRAQILLPSGELSALNATKKRLEADKIRLKGTAEFGEINANLEAVKRRIAELNAQGVKLQVTTGEIISNASVQKVNNTIALVKELKKTAGDIRVEFKGNGLDRLNGQANQTVRNFEQIIRDSPSFAISAQQGFIAISNNIGPLTDSFGRLAAEAKASGQSIGSALKGALTGWNAVGIAISLAVTAVAIFGKEIFGVNEKAKKLKDEFEEIKELVNSTKFTFGTGIAKQTGQITEVRELVNIANDANRVGSTRQEALNRLLSIDKSLFGNLKIGKEGVEGITKAYQEYEKRILATSVVDEKKGKIDELAIKREQQKLKLLEASTKATSERLKLEQLQAKVSAGEPLTVATPGGGFAPTALSFQLDAQQNKLNEAAAAYDQYAATVGSLNQAILREQLSVIGQVTGTLGGDEFSGGGAKANDDLREFLQRRKELLQLILDSTDKFSTEYGTLTKEIANIDFQLANLDAEGSKRILDINKIIFGEQSSAIDKELQRIKAEYTNTINEIRKEIIDSNAGRLEQEFSINFKFDVATNFNQEELLGRARELYDLQIQLINIQEQIDAANASSIQNQVIREETLSKVAIKSVNDRIAALESLKQKQQEVNDKVQEYIDKTTEADAKAQRIPELSPDITALAKAVDDAKKLNDQLAQILASGVADLFGTIFEKAAEGTLTFQTLGESVVKFTQDIIKAVAKLLIMNAILKSLGVAATGGTSAAGSGFDFLEFLFRGFKPRKFATGGIITGPTFGMVGESGTEAVLPLNYLNNLLSDVGGSANLQARVSGDDLLFVMSRANKRNNRFF